MYDCIIIGAGPAGMSAALYTQRAGRSTLLLTNGGSALERAEHVDNYFGFAETVSGKQLLDAGMAQIKRLGVEVVDCQVVKLEPYGSMIVHTNKGTFEGRSLLLATGAGRTKKKGLNLDQFEGRGVSYCAVCDGFFFKGKNVAVLGGGDYAHAEAEELSHFAGSVTVLTDGETETNFGEIKTVGTAPVKLHGTDKLEEVELADGSRIKVDGLFVAIGVASAVDFARSAGIVIGSEGIEVDKNMQTSVPNVFAAGDCIGGLRQISTAVGEGAIAGTAMVLATKK